MQSRTDLNTNQRVDRSKVREEDLTKYVQGSTTGMAITFANQSVANSSNYSHPQACAFPVGQGQAQGQFARVT